VLESFSSRAEPAGVERAKQATSVMNELLKLNEGVDERLAKTQEAIGQRIEKVSVCRMSLTPAQGDGRGPRRRRVDRQVPRRVEEAAAPQHQRRARL
jgi:hypothetical protein